MPALYQFRHLFYPSIFDSLYMREAKIHGLVHCFVAKNPMIVAPPSTLPDWSGPTDEGSSQTNGSTTEDDDESSETDGGGGGGIGGGGGGSGGGGGATSSYAPSAKRLMELLICLDEFKAFPSTHITTVIAFRIFALLLSRFPKIMMNPMYEYLRELLLNYPQFLHNVIELIRQLQRECKAAAAQQQQQQQQRMVDQGSASRRSIQQAPTLQPPQSSTSTSTTTTTVACLTPDLPSRLLMRFNNVLTTIQPHKLVDYLPLLSEIAMLVTINPCQMIEVCVHASTLCRSLALSLSLSLCLSLCRRSPCDLY
jgi:hypothetical protein